jgi:hypothetical protein
MESLRDLLGLIEAPADFFRGLRRKQQLPHYRGCGKSLPPRQNVHDFFRCVSRGATGREPL